MELWRLQRTYGLAARSLRTRGLHGDVGEELVQLEVAAACALAWSDRIATELAVRRLALRATRARARRLLKALRGTRLLSVALPGLARSEPELTAGAVQAWLLERAQPGLAALLGQLRGELEQQATRTTDAARRLDAALEAAEREVRRLAVAVDALPVRRS